MNTIVAGGDVRAEVGGTPFDPTAASGTLAGATAAPRPGRELRLSRRAAVGPVSGLAGTWGFLPGRGWGR
jgi:hypothetical protein